jgi:hypothetical protein
MKGWGFYWGGAGNLKNSGGSNLAGDERKVELRMG